MEYEQLLYEYSGLKEQLTVVIEDRADLLFHKAVTLKTDYIVKVGKLEYELFHLECDISRIKRKIEMVQAYKNNLIPVNENHIEKQLDKEYKEYIKKLEEMAADVDTARLISKCDKLSDEEAKELKKLYRILAKKLHPDLNPNPTGDQKSLWSRVSEAYEAGDLGMLKVLQTIAADDKETDHDSDTTSSLEKLQVKINILREKLREVIYYIGAIKKAFPFNVADFLANRKAVENRQAGLKAEISKQTSILEEYREYLRVVLETEYESSVFH